MTKAYGIDVCIVLEGTYPASIGGISTWVHDLVSNLPEIRFAIARVGPLPHPSTWAFRPAPNVVDVIEVPQQEGDIDLASIDSWSAAAARILPPAAIYQAVAAGLAAPLAEIAAQLHGARFLLSEHASYVGEIAQGAAYLESGKSLPMSGSARREIAAVFAAIAHRAYSTADALTALDASTRTHQIEHGSTEEKSFLIPNGVELSTPAYLSAESENFHAAYIGRVNPLKGTDLFIEAAKILSDTHADVEFSIIGPADGPRDFTRRCHALSQPLGNKILWHGARARYDWGRTPDCVVISSRSEAQPLVVLEAFARGIPVVAFDVGDCRQMILGDVSAPAGVVASDKTPRGLASGIATLARDRKLCRALGRNAHHRAATRYSLKSTVSAYHRLYTTLTASK